MLKPVIPHILSLVCILSATVALAQRDTTYFDRKWERTNNKDAAFFWRETVKLNTGIYSVDDYYRSGTKQMAGYFTSLTSEEKTGHFIYYDTAGSKTSECDFLNNQVNGELILYRLGTGEVWYVTTYKNGKLNGNAASFYKSGKTKRKESFVDDELVWGKCYDEDGKGIVYTPFEVMPEPRVDIPSYLPRMVRYPTECKRKNIQGRVLVKFYVDEKGKVAGTQVIESAHPLLDKEALRVVKSLPKWNPGKLDDEPVKVYYTLPIAFKL